MSEFIHAANIGDVTDPGKMLVEIDGEMIALFHVGGLFMPSMTFARTTEALLLTVTSRTTQSHARDTVQNLIYALGPLFRCLLFVPRYRMM